MQQRSNGIYLSSYKLTNLDFSLKLLKSTCKSKICSLKQWAKSFKINKVVKNRIGASLPKHFTFLNSFTQTFRPTLSNTSSFSHSSFLSCSFLISTFLCFSSSVNSSQSSSQFSSLLHSSQIYYLDY